MCLLCVLFFFSTYLLDCNGNRDSTVFTSSQTFVSLSICRNGFFLKQQAKPEGKQRKGGEGRWGKGGGEERKGRTKKSQTAKRTTRESKPFCGVEWLWQQWHHTSYPHTHTHHTPTQTNAHTFNTSLHTPVAVVDNSLPPSLRAMMTMTTTTRIPTRIPTRHHHGQTHCCCGRLVGPLLLPGIVPRHQDSCPCGASQT